MTTNEIVQSQAMRSLASDFANDEETADELRRRHHPTRVPTRFDRIVIVALVVLMFGDAIAVCVLHARGVL